MDGNHHGLFYTIFSAPQSLEAMTESQIGDPAEWAGKPNSVAGDHLSRPVVADRLVHPTHSLRMSNDELRMANDESFNIQHSAFSINEAGRLSLLIWACWRWGLPCRDCHQPRGALLPHHFTIAGETSKRQKSKTSKNGNLWTVRHLVIPFLAF